MLERKINTKLSIKQKIRVYRSVYHDPRTPMIARWALWIALGYALSPIDLIPDFIPVLGHLDDIIIIPLLLWLASFFIPKQVYEEHRRRYSPQAHQGNIKE